jgi:hypothetical protein
MYLIESIIQRFENDTDDNALALQALLPIGHMISEFDKSDLPEPYCILKEGETTMLSSGTNYAYRVEKTPIIFWVVTKSTGSDISGKQQCYDIVEAIDNAYQTTCLNDIGSRVVIGAPEFEARTPIERNGNNLDNWECKIAFSFQQQKSFA